MILAIDTSSISGSIALVDNGKIIGELTVTDAGAHASWLMRGLDGFLKEAGTRLEDIDFFAVAVGPGSFTGLRIGISALKGMAWTLNKKIIPVSTLEALSLNVEGSASIVCPVLDARKGEVYSAIYKVHGGQAEAILPDSAMKPEELFEKIRGSGTSPVFIGQGLGVYSGRIREEFENAQFSPSDAWVVKASKIAYIAAKRESFAVGPHMIAPVYLRKSEAEIKAS